MSDRKDDSDKCNGFGDGAFLKIFKSEKDFAFYYGMPKEEERITSTFGRDAYRILLDGQDH